ncbi:MAG: response regulator transcription factor [Faecalibacterium sp.]|nr:response regulator transcription factor [Faecalibacterium sp.]
MLNFVICDDEAIVRRQLVQYIRRLESDLDTSIDITEFSSGMDLLENYPMQTDILFLDIRMNILDGIETAHRIRKFSPQVCIIFITSMVQYALSCYKVHPFSFIQKPVQYGEFRSEVQAALRTVRQHREHMILVTDTSGSVQYPLNSRDILYIEVRDHVSTLHLEERTITIRQKLKKLEEDLTGQGFMRCHASYLVNMRQIRSVEISQLQMKNGDTIPISKQRRKPFLTALTDFAGAML